MENNIGVYIHFPYCEKKCPYCDFNSHVTKHINHQLLLDSYIKDFNQQFAKLKSKPQLKSIFFGGGTPSLMQPQTCEKLISHIKNSFQEESIEVTLEANPSSFEVQKFKDFKSAGVNRVSIGVQSFIENDLKKLGRLHDSSQAIKAIESAKEIFSKWSFDLIYARHGTKTSDSQNLIEWEKELTFALNKFQPNHVSLYSLTIEKGTEFFSLSNKNELFIPQNQDEFYDLTNQIAQNFGLLRYEISNYSTNTENECKHNLIYWQGQQYIGIGPGAHGRIITNKGRIATMNFHQPDKYNKLMQESGDAFQTFEEITQEQTAWEIVSTGMRTKYGFKKSEDIHKFLDDEKINILVQQNLIINENIAIKPTEKGLDLCDSIVKFIFKKY